MSPIYVKEDKETSFEKRFPSLNKYLGDDRVICVTISEVEKHCFDKQRVKEVLNNQCLNHDIHPCEIIRRIKQELGLE